MPATWCATPNARCWWSETDDRRRETYFVPSPSSVIRPPSAQSWDQFVRQRVRPIAARPVAPKISPALPHEQAEEAADESGAGPGADLQRMQRECREPQ